MLIFTTILSHIFAILSFSYTSYSESMTICYGDTFTIHCSDDNFIVISVAAFGYFHAGNNCNAQSNADCWLDSTYFLSALCTGHHTCESKVQYSHDLSSKYLRNKCASIIEPISSTPALFVQYSCVTSTLLTSIQESKGLDTDHAGGYFATHDYQLSIKTPEWKTDLSEVYCTKWSLPSVISIPAGSEGLGIVLKLRDIGELYRPLNIVDDYQESSSSLDSNSLQTPASKGGLYPPSPAFHCPANSDGEGCLTDFLRLDITSSDHRRLRLEVCPYAQTNITTEVFRPDFKPSSDEEEQGELYYGLATAPLNSPIMVFGPIYNFTSIEFMINLQLGGGPISHLGVRNELEMGHHGWVKGLLFEYILLHCPQIPNDLEGGGQVRYALQTHNDATGATVAVAEAACPPNAFFFPSAKAAEIEAINGTVAEDFLENLGTLQNQLMLTCDHHHKTWVPALPTGGCKTRNQIIASLRELVNSKIPTTAAVATASPGVTLMNVTEVEELTTSAPEAESKSSNLTTMEMPIFIEPGIPAAVLGEKISNFSEGTHLSHGSSAAVGAIFGFLLCILILIIILFVFRQRLSRLVRSKLVASNTLPGRFPGSGMFMNTLSGSLTFSRHRKNPYFSPSHHPTVLMSQSVVSIPNHHLPPQQTQPWFDNVPLKPTSNAVSLGNLHSLKPQSLPHPPPAPIPPPPDLDLLNSDTYTMQQSYQFPHHQQQNRPASSVHTQNSASMSTRRQTLLSADTMTTNVSAGGQPSPSIAMGNRRVSTDVLGEGFVESPDVNQVFSATLPWKSKPQGGITVGLKRLSTFIRSAVSGSSASFHSHHSNQSGGSHPGQQTGSAMQTPGLFTKRQQFAGGGWPSGSFASSSATPAANSMGLLSSGQSRSSYTSEATLQPISPLSSLGRSSLGHISSDRKPQICLVDPSLCRLNHQHARGDQQQTLGTTNGNAGVGSMMRRGNRESTPLPPLPPQHPHHSNSNSSGPSSHIPQHQETTGTITVRGTKGKTGTLNMDTYLEPIDGADPMGQQSTNAGVEDLSVTEIISGGTLSEDSDTGNQASWQSVSPDGANSGTNTNVVVIESKDSPQVVPSSSRNGITADCASGIDDGVSDTAPIAMSDPTVSLGDGSFDEDSSAADYFTYDEGRRSNARKKHNKVIRRPRLSPPSTRSRPLSDAMLSNHYYDKSELLSPDMIPGLDGAPEALFDPQFHDPDSRPTSVGVYSNDEEEVDEDEDSSLYEAVDRRARKVGTLPPAPHPPPPPQISTPPQHNANTIEMFSSHRNANSQGFASPTRYQRYRGSTKTAPSTHASTSTLIGDGDLPTLSYPNDLQPYANF